MCISLFGHVLAWKTCAYAHITGLANKTLPLFNHTHVYECRNVTIGKKILYLIFLSLHLGDICDRSAKLRFKICHSSLRRSLLRNISNITKHFIPSYSVKTSYHENFESSADVHLTLILHR